MLVFCLTILFLLWFALMMIGGVAADIFDGIFDTNIEALGADASFKALTFQGIMAFLMFFGLAGLYTLKADGGDSLAIIAGGAAGFASMYGTGKLFQFFIGLQASGTVKFLNPSAREVRFTCVFPKTVSARFRLKRAVDCEPSAPRQKMAKASPRAISLKSSTRFLEPSSSSEFDFASPAYFHGFAGKAFIMSGALSRVGAVLSE